MLIRLSATLLACAAIPACLDAKGDDYDFGGADDKSDSYADRVGLLGGLDFGTTTTNRELEADYRIIGYDFTLPEAATVALATLPPTGDVDGIDSVIYLYRKTASGGWGRYLTRDDDGGEGDYSRIERDLTAGTYRLVVKAHDRDDLGHYRVDAACLAGRCEFSPAESCEAFLDWSESACADATTSEAWVACLGDQRARAEACCLEDAAEHQVDTGSQPWCGPIGGDLAITATSLPEPATLRWLTGIAALDGLAPGVAPSDAAVTRVLYLAHELFGNECDALPLGPGLRFETYDDVEGYFEEMRGLETEGWESAPTATNLQRLEETVAAGGAWRAFVGDTLPEACAGSGTAWWHLIWNVTTQQVYFTTWVEYAE